LNKETAASIASKIKKLSERADNHSNNIIYGKNASEYENKESESEPWDEEEFYQHVRQAYYFHDLSYTEQTVTTDANGINHYKDIIKDYGCGHPDNPKREGQKCWCVPECPFDPETGRAKFENNRYVVTRI
jgi:hypothetical protein